MRTTLAASDDVVQTSVISTMAMLVALVAIVAFVGLGIYRARHAAARETQYRALAERATQAQAQIAEDTRTTATELTGLRADLQAARDELAEVKQRLAGLERLLSQIG